MDRDQSGFLHGCTSKHTLEAGASFGRRMMLNASTHIFLTTSSHSRHQPSLNLDTLDELRRIVVWRTLAYTIETTSSLHYFSLSHHQSFHNIRILFTFCHHKSHRTGFPISFWFSEHCLFREVSSSPSYPVWMGNKAFTWALCGLSIFIEKRHLSFLTNISFYWRGVCFFLFPDGFLLVAF